MLILAGNLLVVPLSAILVLLWARLSNTPWRALGFVRPPRWVLGAVLGVLAGIVFKLTMKSVVMPLLGAPPVNEAYRFLAGNPAALPGMLFSVIVGAGFGEETLFRGYLFERLGRLLGRGAGARAAIVLLTALLFGLAHHLEQGMPGVQQATVVGLVYGAVFARTGRLWELMWAHAAFDLTALWIIYWGLETAVARFFFATP